MSFLTFYGGVGEIGGNKILLEHGGRRIWLDFGMSFGQANKYFSEFLQPKKYNGVIDFLEVDLLPRLSDMGGLYREDYLAHTGLRTLDRATYDAVFLTHAHADHSSYIHFLRPDIPVYASNVTKQILAAIEATSTSGFTDFTTFTETFKLKQGKRGGQMVKIKGGESRTPRKFGVMEDSDNTVSIGSAVYVEAVGVNHSVPGACGYIIHTTRGNIVYTGDLRFHGYGGVLTERFIQRAAEARPIALICEGTRIDESENITEQDVQDKVGRIIEKTKNLVIVNYPIRDIERMRSFYQVAIESNRKLVVGLKQAYLLRQLEGTDAGAPSLADKNIAIYIRRKNWGLITKSDYPQNVVEQDYTSWEREFLAYPNRVTCEDIHRNQSDFIIRVDFFELTELIDLKPSEGSCYIRSVTEPFDEEAEIELWRVQNWLKLFNLYPYEQVHASGHASGLEIKRLAHEVNPQVLYPIHTEHPESFEEIVPRGTKLIVPQKGKKYKF